MPDSSSNRHRSHVLFIFLDGVGLGDPDQRINPFSKFHLPAFESLAGGQKWTQNIVTRGSDNLVVRAIDATLGVDGLPQSGTGQATLFTGINCARAIGRHHGPYPHSQTKPIIAEKNIFAQISRLPFDHPEPSAFANAYPDRFFESAKNRDRWTVTTLSCIESSVPIRTYDNLRRGEAVAADLTGAGWVEHLGYDMEPIAEADAARRLLDISKRHPFTLFEYYMTDKAGHSQSAEACHVVLSSLDAFFGALQDNADFETTTLLVTSDHGNLEDLGTKSHTLNPVPFIAMGPNAGRFSNLTSLTDVTPAILTALA